MKGRYIYSILLLIIISILLSSCGNQSDEMKERIAGMYGENQKISGSCDGKAAVKCSNGTFVGSENGSVISYKGIPYAEPPTGKLRWKAPIPAAADDGVYEAYYFGHSPIQTEWPSEPGSYYPQSEDCLTLNIWTNKSNNSTSKPVMVFFHGGSYGWGAASDPIYDGYNLIRKFDDIILVSVEFRNGIYGFMDFSSVKGGEKFRESGNLGLLDQKCALEWVQANIEGFGGDPDNVTIFGESSGAGSVSLLPLIEGTDGLFARMIAQSGSIALTYSRQECRNLTQMLLEETGCSDMDGLMALSENELRKVNEKLNDYNNFPERDGIVLPEDLYEAYRSGKSSGVDILTGTNADEVNYWVWEMGYTVPVIPGSWTYKLMIPLMYENNMRELQKDEAECVDSFMSMKSGSKTKKLSEFYTEVLFRVPAMRQAALHADNDNSTYVYYWTYPCSDKEIGACHAVELAYVFNNPEEDIYTGGNYDTDLADTVQHMWVNFARTGDPSIEEHPWAEYDTDSRKTMVLGSNIRMESDIKAEQRKMLEPILDHYFNGCYTQLDLNVPQTYRIIAIALIIIAAILAIVILSIRSVRRKHKSMIIISKIF